MGICFGKSFNNYHPIYNDFFIPYYDNIKTGSKSAFISPMMLDWAKYWRNSDAFNQYGFLDCINKMNTNTKFAKYYDNAINFFKFSESHNNYEIGFWGQKHKAYLKENHRVIYYNLLTQGKLNSYLHGIDIRAKEQYADLS